MLQGVHGNDVHNSYLNMINIIHVYRKKWQQPTLFSIYKRIPQNAPATAIQAITFFLKLHTVFTRILDPLE